MAKMIYVEPYAEILAQRRDTFKESDPTIAGAVSGCLKLLEIQPTVNAVEIPDCKKCAFNDGIAYWHQCEHCLGEARNNFVPISEVNSGAR